jgi:hypothetical protein
MVCLLVKSQHTKIGQGAANAAQQGSLDKETGVHQDPTQRNPSAVKYHPHYYQDTEADVPRNVGGVQLHQVFDEYNPYPHGFDTVRGRISGQRGCGEYQACDGPMQEGVCNSWYQP